MIGLIPDPSTARPPLPPAALAVGSVCGRDHDGCRNLVAVEMTAKRCAVPDPLFSSWRVLMSVAGLAGRR